jgi:hypothetical protein
MKDLEDNDYFTKFKQHPVQIDYKKRMVPVGIYGSFSEKSKVYLKALRGYLAANNCYPMVGYDIKNCPRPSTMTSPQYNLKITRVMLRFCLIHIFIILKEDEGDHDSHQSTSMELMYLDDHRARYVRMNFEKGSLKQSHSPFRGILDNNTNWPYDEFKLKEKDGNIIVDNSILLRGLTYCYDVMLRDTSLGYNSLDDFNNNLRRICLEETRTP